MSGATEVRFYSSAPSNPVDLIDEEIKKKVRREFRDDFKDFSEIPEKINLAFYIANLLWKRHNSEADSHKNPQTIAWRDNLFMPLINEGLLSKRREDLSMLYAWVNTCRFAFGFRDGHPYPYELQETLTKISNNLIQQIGNDSNKIVQLLEYLSDKYQIIHAPGNDNKYGLDYIGIGNLCQLLCRYYYYNSSVTLTDLTGLCRSKILVVATSDDCGAEFYLASLIACKAEHLLPKASLEEKQNFLEAFHTISLHFYRHSTLKKILGPFFEIAKAENVQEHIGLLAQKLNNERSIK